MSEKLVISSKDRGIVSFLFPGLPIYDGVVPPFSPHKSYVIFSSKDIEYSGKFIVQVKPFGDPKVDTVQGFLSFLSLSKKVEEYLSSLDEEAFWKTAKLFRFLGGSSASFLEGRSTVFNLFVSLFEEYGVSYSIYRGLKESHRVVFSSLLTMMLKTRMVETLSVSSGYKRALIKNRQYMRQYSGSVIEYIDTEMEEEDFLSFLFAVSSSGRQEQ